MMFACEGHLEQVIDRFVYETEQPPEMYLVERADLIREAVGGCLVCAGEPKYVLARFGEVGEKD
ncbi:MAG: CxxH/CxxC protein [Clostridia bacterium]|nr:CxxH/CxxC protein [Clostridia bacterium]